MVYAKDLKSFVRKNLWVRVPPRALFKMKNKLEENNFISWQAPEFEYRHKDISWYWLSVIAAIIVAALAVWQKNFLFAIFVIIAELVVVFSAGRFPTTWEFTINDQGIEIGRPDKKGKKFYPYKELESFDIHQADEERGELVLKSQSRFKPFIKISIHSQDEEKIKDFLLKFLPQEEISASAIDSVSKLIKF